MYEEKEKNSKSQFFNAYYKVIGEAYIENILNEASNKEEKYEEIEFPKTLDTWFESFHKTWKKKRDWNRRIKKIMKVSVRVAVFLAALISIMAVMTMSVEAFRIRFLNLFISRNDSYTEIKVDLIGDTMIPDLDAKAFYYFSYLPDGYEFLEANELNSTIFMIYSKDEEPLYFTQSFLPTDYQLNTENALVENVMIGEYEGMFISNQNSNLLFWTQETVAFLLDGQISKEEMLKMVKNMKKNK